MSTQGSIDSWNERIDYCLGKAANVLTHATDNLLGDRWVSDEIEAASVLAEAWRDLATTWNEREEWEVAEEPPKRSRTKARAANGDDNA